MDRPTVLVVACAAALLAGCVDRPTVLPNRDPQLNRPTTQIIADAQARFPYPADLGRGEGLQARAEIGYTLNSIKLVNFTGQPWSDVDVWVNRTYVVNLSTVPSNEVVSINFKHLFNEQGQRFPLDNRQQIIQSLEVRLGDQLFAVPFVVGR